MATPVVAGAAALMIQKDPTLTPDTIKARMMKTAWKGYPTTSWAYDARGVGYLSQYDVFTIGAGYLDVDAVLGSTDVASGGASFVTMVKTADLRDRDHSAQLRRLHFPRFGESFASDR